MNNTKGGTEEIVLGAFLGAFLSVIVFYPLQKILRESQYVLNPIKIFFGTLLFTLAILMIFRYLRELKIIFTIPSNMPTMRKIKEIFVVNIFLGIIYMQAQLLSSVLPETLHGLHGDLVVWFIGTCAFTAFSFHEIPLFLEEIR